MERGEVFYITVDLASDSRVIGFASHRVDGQRHGIAVYVRGAVARQGVESALYRLAESEAIRSGAAEIHVDASLAAVGFYVFHGFIEVGRGEHQLRSGVAMPCVFMQKRLV